ncbi:MAG: hypothetical protein RIS35_2744 [Pseudomonadota bacterium]|jgi:hypothetical protein
MRSVQTKPYVAAEHEFEPQHGLPEPLPTGERLVWQGGPRWTVLARRAFHADKVTIYFAILLAMRFATLLHDGAALGDALRALGGWLLLAATGVGLLLVLAWMSARSTVYTLTDRRIVMRIGIVLTVTYNLPLTRIHAADLRPFGRGNDGEIALALEPGTRIAWLHLWPHARPWRIARPQPMLRALADGRTVSTLLADVWSQANGSAVRPAQRAAAPRSETTGRPSLATR